MESYEGRAKPLTNGFIPHDETYYDYYHTYDELDYPDFSSYYDQHSTDYISHYRKTNIKPKRPDNYKERFVAASSSSSYSGHQSCCPHVLDPGLLATILTGLAVATFLLRQSITMNIMGRRKRGVAFETLKGEFALLYCTVHMHAFLCT